MIPYYIAFLLSGILCYLGEYCINKQVFLYLPNEIKKQNKKRKNDLHRFVFHFPHIKASFIYFSLSVLIVSLLAGARGYTVGTDIESYGNSLFEYARIYSGQFPMYLVRFSHIEPLYLFLVYVSAQLSSEPHMLYFLTGVLIYSFMLAGFVKLRKYASITLCWLGFLFLLYGDTYNAMRQMIALAIVFWGFNFLLEKRYLMLAVSVFVAFLFHNTAIIFGVIVLVYLILQFTNKAWIKLLMLIGAMVSVMMFNQILGALMQVGLLQEKMERYTISQSTGLSLPAILIRLPFLILILFQRKKFWAGSNIMSGLMPMKNKAEGDFLLIMLLIEMYTVELSAFIGSLYRISLYFVPFRAFSYARYCSIQKKRDKLLSVMLLIVYLLIIFIYQNQIKGNNEIYPYVFGV